MKKILICVMFSGVFFAVFNSFIESKSEYSRQYIETLREMYSKDSKFWDAPFVDENVEWSELEALLQTPPYPKDNPYSKEKEELGKKLFNDPRLSLSNQIACATCHDREQGYSNARSLAFGHDRILSRRNAQSVLMSAFGDTKFWDGRANSLESQVLFPLLDSKEMASSLDSILAKLKSDKEYIKLFNAAFSDKDSKVMLSEAKHLSKNKTDSIESKKYITIENLTKAIATFERSLMPKNNKFDKFLSENKNSRLCKNIDSKEKLESSECKKSKKQILSDNEIVGLHIFRTKARCMNCHSGAAFSDFKYHNLGLSFYGTKWQDLGRAEITNNPSDSGKFKTPSLRSVSKTAPYMHNGRYPNLEVVLKSYNAGMYHFEPKNETQQNDPFFPKTDSILKPLNLTPYELKALESFLLTL